MTERAGRNTGAAGGGGGEGDSLKLILKFDSVNFRLLYRLWFSLFAAFFHSAQIRCFDNSI